MPPVRVNVKWGKQKFDGVEVNTEDSPETFKAQLFTLSGVPPDRQKLMVKGKTIQDEAWGDVKLTEGTGIMMMGSTEGVPVAPPPRAKDADDVMEEDDAMPLGLVNLGNTCYLNATLQCFRAVPELRQALKGFSGKFAGWGSEMQKSESITAAVKGLYDEMDRFPNQVVPLVMVETMRKVYPRFAEQSSHGGFAQQDANEAWTELMTNLKRQLKPDTPRDSAGTREPRDSAGGREPRDSAGGRKPRDFVEQYMQGEFSVTMKCKESDTEPVVQFKEPFLQLSCFIDPETKYIQAGLSSRMKETITKRAETLGRDAEFEKSIKIDRLPAYLTVQLVRFFFKERAAVGAKVLKDVKFPLSLDVFELCSEELQKKLTPNRSMFKEKDDHALQRDVTATAFNKRVKTTVEGVGVASSSFLTDKDPSTGRSVVSFGGLDDVEWKEGPVSFPDDLGSSNSGYYDLQAVLTHQGRTNNSGHYVAWVRKTEDVWLKFDDEKVTPVSSDEVLKLSGGGDWHCAYLLLYGPRPVPLKVKKEAGPVAQKSSHSLDMPPLE